MKQLIVLAGCVVVLSGLAGCQNTDKGVEVIVEGGGEFPESLVGTWQADKQGWEIVFEPGGTISSVVINLGRVRMKPGQVTRVPTKMGGKGVFEPEQWLVNYAPADRELTVKISLKHFYIELGNNILKGKCTDVLTGKIDKNGKTWLVDWFSFPDYTAHTEKHPNFDLSVDPNDGVINVLTFKKVAEEQ